MFFTSTPLCPPLESRCATHHITCIHSTRRPDNAQPNEATESNKANEGKGKKEKVSA